MGDVIYLEKFVNGDVSYVVGSDEHDVKGVGLDKFGIWIATDGPIKCESIDGDLEFEMSQKDMLNLLVSTIAVVDPDMLDTYYCQRKLGIEKLPCVSNGGTHDTD